MAHKSGLSHGLAALISLVLGAVLLEYIKPAFPEAIEKADSIAASTTELLESTFGITIAPDLFPPLLVAFLLAFLWGLAYHFSRKR